MADDDRCARCRQHRIADVHAAVSGFFEIAPQYHAFVEMSGPFIAGDVLEDVDGQRWVVYDPEWSVIGAAAANAGDVGALKLVGRAFPDAIATAAH